MSTVALDVEAVRARFSALRQPLAFFDGPGGTQVPDEVIDAVSRYYRESNANVSGPYDTTCDGSPSLNGNTENSHAKQPCAGCVGNADNKNPAGQLPNAAHDGNNGYECDNNHGVGQTNPAHSGCTTNRFYQIDLVRGPVLATLGPAGSTNFYAAQGRLLDTDLG